MDEFTLAGAPPRDAASRATVAEEPARPALVRPTPVGPRPRVVTIPALVVGACALLLAAASPWLVIGTLAFGYLLYFAWFAPGVFPVFAFLVVAWYGALVLVLGLTARGLWRGSARAVRVAGVLLVIAAAMSTLAAVSLLALDPAFAFASAALAGGQFWCARLLARPEARAWAVR